MNDELKLRFTGVADLKPQVLRAKELAAIIENFEAAIVATVIDYDPTIKREQIAVSLVSVQDQSVGLIFVPNLPDLTYKAAFRIIEALTTQQFNHLPQQALGPLRSLVRFVRSRGCTAELSIARGQRSAATKITPTTRIETRERQSTFLLDNRSDCGAVSQLSLSTGERPWLCRLGL
jgi:hypothetical protein